MSDDAIHDILEQTESDPAFQALFDLFDNSNYDIHLLYRVLVIQFFFYKQPFFLLILYVFADKNKFPDGETGDADVSSSPEESDAAGSSSTCLQSDDPGIMIQDYTDYRIRNVTSRSLGESIPSPRLTPFFCQLCI